MKKTLAFVLVCVMAITSLVGCGSNAEKAPEAEVTLLGVTMKEHQKETTATTAFVPRLLAAPETVGEAPAAGTDAAPNDDEYISYIVIYRTQELVDFTIHLDNPKDYYIFDFILTSSDESVEIEINGKFKPLKDCKSIRWNSDDNETCTYTLRLPDTDKTEATDIRIGAMYYSDREDGTNRLHVNMNNRENYDIYRTDAEIKFLRRQNSNNFFEFDLEKTDVDTITVKVNGEEVLPEPSTESEAYSTYRLPSEGELTIDYSSEVEAGKVYHNIYKENIQFLKFERTRARNCVADTTNYTIIYCKISGTDFNYGNVTIKDHPGVVADLRTAIDGQYILFDGVNPSNFVLTICGTEFPRSFFDSLPAPQQ